MATLHAFSAPVPGGAVSNILSPVELALLAFGMQVPLPEEQPAATLTFVAPTLTLTLQADAAGFELMGGVPFGTITGATFSAPDSLGGHQLILLTGLSIPAGGFVGMLRDQDVQSLYDLILGGDDLMIGGAGADLLTGHGGHDSMSGGGDNDTLIGGGGNDSIAGDLGSDIIEADGGADTVLSGADDDTVFGGKGDDVISGDAGNDSIIGEDGNDSLNGGADADTLSGGDGRDVISGDAGNDIVYGDRAFPDAGTRAGKDTLFGHDGNDTLFGMGARDDLFGGLGDDVLSGGGGGDRLTGAAGADTLAGGGGADIFHFDDLSELGVLPGELDVILDFNPLEGDRIGLRAMDANSLREGNQAFRFITDPSQIAAGRVLVAKAELAGRTGTLVSIHTDGDANPDGQIFVLNVTGLTAADFML
jgi:serralysin